MARSSTGNEVTAAPATEMGKMRRRGVMAAAAAVIAGLAVRGVTDAEPVAANDGVWNQPYSGTFSTSGALAAFINTGSGIGVEGSSNGGNGVYANTNAPTGSWGAGLSALANGSGTYGVYASGFGAGIGVYGTTSSATGVYGNAGSGTGVIGTSTSSDGVYGSSSTGNGVYGVSSGANAVFGNLFGGVAGTAAVYGDGDGAGTYGVYGLNNGGPGVYGNSPNNVGVLGVSNAAAGGQPYGVAGSVTAAPGFGLFGVTSIAGTVAFAGGAAVAGAIAGQLSGPFNLYNSVPGAPGNLYVQGNLTVSGAKSATVPHPDGSHRLLYCVESPESWFEDFGEGTITGGKATVALDPDFAAVVDTSKLHVFLTPHDTTHHLAVTARAGSGFSVGAGVTGDATARGAKASDLNGTFTYRVVAKRKDITAERLAKFAVPQEIKAPALVIPNHPEPKKGTPPALPPAPKVMPDIKMKG